MIPRRPYRLLLNRRHGVPGTVTLPEGGWRRARETITAWPGYAPTPLRDLPALAAAARVAAVACKDEGGRFGQGSFKALGGAYAVQRALAAELARRGVAPAATAAALEAGIWAEAQASVTVACASAGNHGRSVAWGARRFGCRCVVLVHPGVPAGARAVIAALGAEVREVPGTYDDAVRAAREAAPREGWLLVSDTAWAGHLEGPREVMQGYRLMAEEALGALERPPTHLFVPGGVGGAAAAVSVQARARAPGARLVVAEPEAAACLMASAEAGEPARLTGPLATALTCLGCGEPSLLAWQELERAAFAYVALPDAAAADAAAAVAALEPPLRLGASGAAGLAALLLVAGDPYARAALGLDADSRVLAFGTEGPEEG